MRLMRWAAHHFSSMSRRKYSLLKVVGLKLQGPSKPDLSLWHLQGKLRASPPSSPVHCSCLTCSRTCHPKTMEADLALAQKTRQ